MEEENKVVDTAAEEAGTQAEEVKKEATKEVKQEKTFSRDELAKIMAAEKEKWKAELEAEKTQAEKLAKMNAEEKITQLLVNMFTVMELLYIRSFFNQKKGLPP